MKIDLSFKKKSLKGKLLILTLCIGLIIIPLAFSAIVIKDFSHPLVGSGDIDYWEYTGFYVAKNFKWLPFPHLDLVNNQSFYPYGTNTVFQPWSFERDIFYAIFYSLFGIGPWLKFYYLFSVVLAFLGTSVFLHKDYGWFRAIGVGILASFSNFYAIHKYPDHLSYAVIHWTVISLVSDFILVKRVILKQHISLRLILIKALLVILSLGQELGYIAGFALMSFTVSFIFILIVLSYRVLIQKNSLGAVARILGNYRKELIKSFYSSCSLIGLIIGASYIYLPLVFQISKEAKSFEFTGVPSGAWWTNPLRLLIPYLPGFNPGQVVFEPLLGDSPEGLGAGSPGWFLLILGVVGLWQARRKIIIFIPLLIIFLLCLFYHPANLPTLKIFPWFAFNRVGGRNTVLYPVILSIFALNINFEGLRNIKKTLLLGLLVFLACTEVYTAYSLKLGYQPYLLDNNFLTYMNYVKQQPGEAVLDWPFCVTGGNSVGALEGLCPYYLKNSSIFALRRFHEKKVMGQYFGRLHPSQIEPYIQAGWEQLFFPDDPDIFKATRQKTCFRPEEWSFFTDFYKFNDFAGINLYVDFLPENCVKAFYDYFGSPTQETVVPGAGKVQFIPKSSELKEQVNLALGAQLKFQPAIDFSESDLIQTIRPYGLKLTGLNPIDQDESGINHGRWSLGPENKLEFILSENQLLELVFEFKNPIDNQSIIVEINGNTVDTMLDIKGGATVKNNLKFRGIKGLNTIRFKYKDWNHNKAKFIPKDERHFAVYFTELSLKKLE